MCAGTACCPLRRIRAAAASLSRSTICWTMRTCSGSPTALRSPSQNRIADEREETMTNDRLPHFVIIGAVKGATTWLHNQLQDNPAINTEQRTGGKACVGTGGTRGDAENRK